MFYYKLDRVAINVWLNLYFLWFPLIIIILLPIISNFNSEKKNHNSLYTNTHNTEIFN